MARYTPAATIGVSIERAAQQIPTAGVPVLGTIVPFSGTVQIGASGMVSGVVPNRHGKSKKPILGILGWASTRYLISGNQLCLRASETNPCSKKKSGKNTVTFLARSEIMGK